MQSSPARPIRPLVSAVMPFLNEAAILTALIPSLEQHHGGLGLPWKLVLLDDGSGHASLVVAQREMQFLPELRATVLFLGGLQLIGLGVQEEYLGSVLEKVRRRPLYLMHERCQQQAGKKRSSP